MNETTRNTELAICKICQKPIGPNNHPGADNYHAACCLEQHGVTGGINAEHYAEACKTREQQIKDHS